MTNEQLCALTLAAIDDADAMTVLQDVVHEMPEEQHEPISARVIEEFGYWSATIDARTNARAIAAVLLFGEWDDDMWPTVERCEWVYYQVADRAGWFGPVHRRDLEGRDGVTIGPTPSRDLRRLDNDGEEAGEQSSFEALGY